jgi:hypothetical protein
MKPFNQICGIIMIGTVLLPCLLHAQGLRIGRGASVVVQGNASLVLNDASFINDGQFSPGNGTVAFTGGERKSNAFIGGGSRTAFNSVLLSRPYSALQLESDVAVGGSLTMSAGNLELNNRRLDLGSSGVIMGEHLNSRITGANGGTVTATAVLNAPKSVNPGNIGVELSSDLQLGLTVITRGHVQQTNSSGQQGIQRYYDVEPAVSTANLSVRFHYLEPELDGNNEAELVLWSGSRSQLTAIGKENSDAATNWLARNNISGMNRFTLGVADRTLLANRIVKGLGHNSHAGVSFLQAYPNPARNRFTVSVYSDSEKQGTVSLQDARGQVLERRQVRYVRGMNTLQWNIARYAAGTYYLVLENTGASNLEVVKH